MVMDKKATHKKTGSEHRYSHHYGDIVVIESLKTGRKRMLPNKVITESYELSEVAPLEPGLQVSEEAEIMEAEQLVSEILAEAEEGPQTIIRISFEPRKPRKPKNTVKPPQPGKEKGPRKESGAPVKGAKPVTLKDLCTELKMDPGQARRLLRKGNIERTEGRWEWSDPVMIAKIKSLLK